MNIILTDKYIPTTAYLKVSTNDKSEAKGKRSLNYAEAPCDCNDVKINCKPRAEDKQSLDYSEAQRDCNDVKINHKSGAKATRVGTMPGK